MLRSQAVAVEVRQLQIGGPTSLTLTELACERNVGVPYRAALRLKQGRAEEKATEVLESGVFAKPDRI